VLFKRLHGGKLSQNIFPQIFWKLSHRAKFLIISNGIKLRRIVCDHPVSGVLVGWWWWYSDSGRQIVLEIQRATPSSTHTDVYTAHGTQCIETRSGRSASRQPFTSIGNLSSVTRSQQHRVNSAPASAVLATDWTSLSSGGVLRRTSNTEHLHSVDTSTPILVSSFTSHWWWNSYQLMCHNQSSKQYVSNVSYHNKNM